MTAYNYNMFPSLPLYLKRSEKSVRSLQTVDIYIHITYMYKGLQVHRTVRVAT